MTEVQSEQHLAVYGSLKHGSWNRHIMEDAKFISDVISMHTDYVMTFSSKLSAGFPVLFESLHMPAGPIRAAFKAELYKVPAKTVKQLDRLEANGIMYERRMIPFITLSGANYGAWVYFGVPSYWNPYKTELPACPLVGQEGDELVYEWPV